MTDWNEYADYHVKRLGGPDSEHAYHSLIEADNAIIPTLIDAFRAEQDPAIRAELVEVIWQHRLPKTADFLSEALNDPVPEVWKSALDGLVAMGGQAAIRALESAKERIRSSHQTKSAQVEWIDEAIQQIKDLGA